MEAKEVQVSQEELKKIAKKIFEGKPLSVEEAMLLTDKEKVWTISSYIWDLVVQSI
jgi:uncharacterized coiled-coil DUF342 family protein